MLTLIAVVGTHADEPPYKLQFENSPDLPNGIAFFMILLELEHEDEKFDRDLKVAWITEELAMSEGDADAFLSEALTTLKLINADKQAQTTALACRYAGPGVDRKAQFAALQEMYAIDRAVSDYYYDATKARLDQATGERLQRWIDERKLGIGHYEIDFEKSYEKRGSEPGDTLSLLCGMTR